MILCTSLFIFSLTSQNIFKITEIEKAKRIGQIDVCTVRESVVGCTPIKPLFVSTKQKVIPLCRKIGQFDKINTL